MFRLPFLRLYKSIGIQYIFVGLVLTTGNSYQTVYFILMKGLLKCEISEQFPLVQQLLIYKNSFEWNSIIFFVETKTSSIFLLFSQTFKYASSTKSILLHNYTLLEFSWVVFFFVVFLELVLHWNFKNSKLPDAYLLFWRYKTFLIKAHFRFHAVNNVS